METIIYFRETNNPYSYPVLSETLLEDPLN